jgi:MFS family permease
MGISSSLFYVAAIKPEIRARFMSLHNSVGWLGAALGALIAGYVITLYGYTTVFLTFSALNALCAFMVFKFRDVERTSNVSLSTLFREGFTGAMNVYLKLPRWLREEKEYTRYCIGIAIRGLGLAITGPIFTMHLKEGIRALTIQIGELSALSSIVRLITMPVLGWVADRRSRKQVFLTGVFLAMVHPILYVSCTSVEQLYPVYVINGLFWACIESTWFAWQMDIIPARRGIYLAILNFFNGTEWAVGPLIGSLIGEAFGFKAAAVVSATAIGLGFLRLLKVPEQPRKSRERLEGS